MLLNDVIAVELLCTRRLACLWAKIEPATSKIEKWSVNSLTTVSPLFLLYSDFFTQGESRLQHFETQHKKISIL
jgi:hypothetical protein